MSSKKSRATALPVIKKKIPCTINPFFLGSDKRTFHAEFRSAADPSKYNFSFERPEHNDSELN